MSEQSSLDIVQQTYGAFGQGNIPGVINNLSEAIAWDSRYPAGVPFGGKWRGHAEVLRFFEVLDQTIEIKEFAIEQFIHQDDTVVVLGHETARIKASDAVYTNAWVHVWAIAGGKVATIRTYNDTATVLKAFQLP